MRNFFVGGLIIVLALAPIGCVTNDAGNKTIDPKVSAVTKEVVQDLLASCQYAAPIAAGVVAAFGDQDARQAMSMASASLGTLSALVNTAASQDQLDSAFDALQVAWQGIDSAYKNDPNASVKLAAIQSVTDAARKAIMDKTSANPQ